MKATIVPSFLKGNILAPASKSSMQRACAAALLAKGKSIIRNPGHSNDDKAAIGIIENLGAVVTQGHEQLMIESNGAPFAAAPSSLRINCGESGLGIRMFTPIVTLSNRDIIIDGEGSLRNRPMDFFDEILPQLGLTVVSNNGKLPLRIKGTLQPQNITIDGSLSSQFLTGLLLAFAAADACDISVKVKNLKSKPYIDLTLDVMKRFGLKTPENQNYETFYFSAASHSLTATEHHYTVEGDWSGGAFLLVAGAIAGDIMVRGLDMYSTQADKAVVEALIAANAGIAVEAKGIKLLHKDMQAFSFDATDCPDLFPPLVALAAYCTGATTIKGVQRLTHKESNRAITLQEEFGKMGVQIELADDIMTIHGGKRPNGTVVHSRHDHRIAMACAVAALRANGETVIEDAEAINKSYPDFYRDLQELGAAISLPNKFLFHE
jgi:3-phosphoshikimate 1-carboxyvinyltransferase